MIIRNPPGYVAQSCSLATKSVDTLVKLLNSSPDVICSIDEEGRFITVSAACRSLWGYEPEELEGMHYLDFEQLEDRPHTSLIAEQIMQGITVSNFENRYCRKDGTAIDVVWSAQWDSKERVMYAVGRDATEKRKTEKGLQKVYKKVRLQAKKINDILESMQDGFFAMDLKWRVTYFNKQAEHLTGKTREEMIGKVFWDVFPSAVNTAAYGEYHRAMQKQVQVSFEMYSQLYKDWFKVIAYPSKTGFSVYFKNISVRKEQEENIKISQERYELLSKATSDAVRDWQIDNDMCQFNKAFKHLFGYNIATSSSYQIWIDKIHEEDKVHVYESIQEALANSEVKHWQKEYRFYRCDNTVAYVLDRSFIIRDDEGKAKRMVGAMQDITLINKADEELRKLCLVAKETSNVVVMTDAE